MLSKVKQFTSSCIRTPLRARNPLESARAYFHGMKVIEEKEKWNDLILRNPPRSGAFLQSWEWGEFQKSFGRPVFRFEDDGRGVQVIEHTLPLGKKYWYVPRGAGGPGLKEEAARRGVLFIRGEPVRVADVLAGSVKTIDISAATSLVLDLAKLEERLLAEMHEKTRYNIRLAARKGVQCTKATRADFDVFWRLLNQTMGRGAFRTHPRAYYQKMLEIPYVELWRADWGGKAIAMGIWSYYAGTVTYLHGASSDEHRVAMAPHLLHWIVMRDAKSRGFAAYDFWGVDLAGAHPSWAGFTRFKTGFGGEVVEYPGTFDLPISRVGYRLYQLARLIRRFG